MNHSLEEAANFQAVSPDKLLHRLREMFGEDRARLLSGHRFRIASEASRVVAFPHDLHELSEIMKLAHDEHWRVIPAGAGTWLEMGNRPTKVNLIVSTKQMTRVVEYEPADLTATVEAGCTLDAFNKRAAEHRQFIPLDPFGDSAMTIGGVIATASSGPSRCAYGTPRDWLIGLTVVHADGRITKAGGKVVKNVAGYDLCKLYTGSYGTLAVIAEMSFKLRALPPREKTIVFYADAPDALCAMLAQITDSAVQPTAMELLSPSDALPLERNRFALALRFLNEAETVESQIEEAKKLGAEVQHTVLSDGDAAAFWRAYRESEVSPAWGFSLRMTGLPADLPAMIADAGRILPRAFLRAHAGNGVLRIHAEEGWLDEVKSRLQPRKIAELRRAAQSRGGQLLILRAPAEITDQLDVWGEAGATAGLMRALKERFDPNALLNPGRFVAGI
ncbi:MAG: FAD-binding oxidoreductase [Blastocatellia bacterium]